MEFLHILVLAAAASMDCIVIGLNYGLKGVRISLTANIFIAGLSLVGTWLSMLAGLLLRTVIAPDWTLKIGGGLFILLGLWMLWQFFSAKGRESACYRENPEMIDRDASKVIELRESLLIGLLLCLNNIGIGIGGGITGASVLATPLACAACSFLMIGAGYLIGSRLASQRFSALLELLPAVLILLLGIKEFL